MKKKQIIVQHPCTFARTGLEGLLSDFPLSSLVNVVSSVDTLWECRASLARFPEVQLVILSLRGEDYTPGDVLGLIVDGLQLRYPRCRVIIMADSYCIRLLEHYFYGLNNVCAIFDHAVPLVQLSSQIGRLLKGQNAEYLFENELINPLSKREQCILGSLLQGKTTIDIAHSLQLSYKTISYYKRSALNKLGIRTFHPLLINEHCGFSRTQKPELGALQPVL